MFTVNRTPAIVATHRYLINTLVLPFWFSIFLWKLISSSRIKKISNSIKNLFKKKSEVVAKYGDPYSEFVH